MYDFKTNPQFQKLAGKKVLVTGGAGFIGSNLCEALLDLGASVVCLDNFVTGHRHNIEAFLSNESFILIEGDIRSLETCQMACKGVDFVLHQAALGSVPRSINDPITSNEVNVSGFLNMLVAARDNGVQRFIYAASSSTYGDSTDLPKVEDRIGKPLSPYAITKYVNELYADIFFKTYGLNTIGLRYFNVFGRRQDPNGAYAAVIPLFIKKLINQESLVINGDGSYSRDFTYIDNVILANLLAAAIPTDELNFRLRKYEEEHSNLLKFKTIAGFSEVFNVAYGKRSSLNDLVNILREILSKYDPEIQNVKIEFGPSRLGDVPHSLASIEKANIILGYNPQYSLRNGLEEACTWYWESNKR